MSWRRDYYDYFPPPSRPRAAKGGIKAQSKRGTFGESWWAKRWIAVLESFHIGARLDRGRSYARRGQVLAISIDKGVVKAKVQGSQPKPYSVAITLKVLSAADWQKLAATLSQQAIYTAKLLAGEMPQDIEQAFKDAKLSLFPAKLQDLETECSCPDWSNPCKHIAAVYYLLGEEFDRNPFLIFKLRGMDRQELVARLDQGGQKAQRRKKTLQSAIANQQVEISLPPEPLVADVSEFWGGGSLPDEVFGEIRVPPMPAALVKRLGNFPFWRGEERFPSAIEPVYTQASARGVDVFLGTRESK
jgi:uncharacterized Zn finger protein